MNPKETAFLIEALRYWQWDMDQAGFILSLSAEEIDDLVQRLKGDFKAA
jgi:hypothetical protein